jgi:hypothetical protein
VETNDLGEYRCSVSRHGKYYVSAGARGSDVSPGEGAGPVANFHRVSRDSLRRSIQARRMV